MQKIAIAGAGGLGSYAVDEFLKHKNEFQLIVLARSANQQLVSKGVTVVVVDYNSVDQLTEALKGVTTLISFLGTVSSEEFAIVQRNLLVACQKANVKRFVPSEWAGDPSKPAPFELYAGKQKFRSDLESSGIEYTLVGNGLFMDYLLPKGTKKYAKDVVIPVNPEEATARIPGSGNVSVTLTTCEDIGKAVVALVRYKGKWPKYFYVAGQKATWNQILASAEKATGKSFKVEYKPEEELRDVIQNSTDPMKKFYAQVDLVYATGELDLPEDKESKEILKDVKFTTVDELLQKAYGNK